MDGDGMTLREIFDDLDALSGDELRVVRAITGRMRLGRERYGQLDIVTDRRDWRREAREELLDFLVYDRLATELGGTGDGKK